MTNGGLLPSNAPPKTIISLRTHTPAEITDYMAVVEGTHTTRTLQLFGSWGFKVFSALTYNNGGNRAFFTLTNVTKLKTFTLIV